MKNRHNFDTKNEEFIDSVIKFLDTEKPKAKFISDNQIEIEVKLSHKSVQSLEPFDFRINFNTDECIKYMTSSESISVKKDAICKYIGIYPKEFLCYWLKGDYEAITENSPVAIIDADKYGFFGK